MALDVTVSRKWLLDKMVKADYAKPTRTNLDILKWTRLTVSGGEIEIAASSSEQTLLLTGTPSEFCGEIRGDGVAMASDRFLQVLRECDGSSEARVYSNERGQLCVECGFGVWEFDTVAEGDFKVLPLTDENPSDMPESELVRLLEQAKGCVAADSSGSPAMEGVLLHRVKSGDWIGVGTDGRGACVSRFKSVGDGDELRRLLPKSAVRMLTGTLDGNSNRVLTVYSSAGTFSVIGDGVFLTTHLVDARFPAYEKVLARIAATAWVITVSRQILLSAISMVMASDEETAGDTVFAITVAETDLTVHAVSECSGLKKFGRSVIGGTAVAGSTEGPIFLSAELAKKTIGALRGDDIIVRGKSNSDPVVFQDVDCTCTTLLMPIESSKFQVTAK